MAIREELDNPHKPKTWEVFRENLKVELRSLPFQQLPQSWLWMFCVYSYNLGLIRWRKKALDILQTPSLSYSRMSWLVLLLLDEEEKCGNGDYLTIWTMNYIGANSRISTMLWSSEHSNDNYILSIRTIRIWYIFFRVSKPDTLIMGSKLSCCFRVKKPPPCSWTRTRSSQRHPEGGRRRGGRWTSLDASFARCFAIFWNIVKTSHR